MIRGEDVLTLQARLLELGFNPSKADGVYGSVMAGAVIAFQSS